MFAASKTAAAAAGTPPPSTDPQFNYVTMLLHGDGTNGAQNNTFVDSSTNNFTITRNGTPTQGSFSPYGDLWSNYFNGSSSFTLAGANSTLTGDFTLEGWLFFDAATTGDFCFAIGNEASGRFAFLINANGTVTYDVFGAGASSLGGTFTRGVWNHFAYVRSGTTISAYINGVSTGTTRTLSGTLGNSFATYVWGTSGGARTSTGYASNLRLVKGTALYTSNFTPSTTPLTAVSGTSLLTCQSNRFRDNSSNNFAITVTGTPSVQRFSPFDPAAEYSTSVIGGSAVMTGTQYLLLGGQSAFSFNADFTVELWFYALGAGTGTPKLYESRGGGQEGAYPTIEHSGTSLIFRMDSAARITTTFAYNTWNHVAAVRSGSTITMYLNGVSAGTYSTSATTLVGTSRPCIGAYPGFDNLNGYVSNLRVVKGTAVYTAAFTPPTAPLTAITNTSLLLNTVNAGIFDNAMMNDLVTVGDAKVSTAVKKYGTGSMYFDGSGDYLNTAETLPYDMGNGNFTAECWAYPVSTQTGGIVRNANSGSFAGFAIAWQSSRFKMLCSYSGSSWAVDVLSSSTYSLNTWHHVAMVRNGSTVTLYVNGTSAATGTVSTNSLLGGQALYVGFSRFSSEFFNGYIDDLRITKGIARYTANFTPPTAAFPNN